MSFQEFKPTILFLARFVGIYVLANILYGIYVTSYEPMVDPATHSLTKQTAFILNTCGYRVDVMPRPSKPTADILYLGKSKLAVYEGCNGINTMIVFAAFLIAFGPSSKNLIWFTLVGFLIVHLANLARITLLFLVSEHLPKAMYFTHKYFFTATLYVVIFTLWFWWVKAYSMNGKQ